MCKYIYPISVLICFFELNAHNIHTFLSIDIVAIFCNTIYCTSLEVKRKRGSEKGKKSKTKDNIKYKDTKDNINYKDTKDNIN